jgi:predicted acyltransferase
MPSFFLSVPGVIAVLGIIVLVRAGARRAQPVRATPGREKTVLTMQVVVSLVVLAAALYVILARPDAPDDHKWAYSIIGTVVGYWLKATV